MKVGKKMSLVTVVLEDKCISMCSDGQITGETGEVIDHNFKKIKKVNARLLIGCTGSAEVTKILFSQLDGLLNKDVITFEDLNSQIGSFSRDIKGGNFSNGTIFEVAFFVCGFDRQKKAKCVVYQRKGLNVTHESYVINRNDEILFIANDPIDVKTKSFSRFNRMMKFTNPNNIKDVANIQKKLNEIVSKESSSVNNNVFTEIIYK